MRKKAFLNISVILMVICMIMIFFFSSQNMVDTNILSHKVTFRLAEIVFSNFDAQTAEIQNFMTDQLNLFVRKMAHFLLFFVLGFASSAAAYIFGKNYRRSFLSGFAVSLIYGTLDELHQCYVPGRTPLVRDAVIDAFGGIFGAVFFFAIVSVIYNIRRICSKK